MTQRLSFEALFEAATEKQPYQWQTDLSIPIECGSRLIRIPTGFGKTLGVLTVWLWHRVIRKDESWPRRLVWCLPMRVLVEQTEREVRSVLDALGHLWDGKAEHGGKVGVHLLMGGTGDSKWQLYPEHEAVLIGTQDMLLSRAMNRGYACPRAGWPMEFGLLSQDALWVMDEVQLMDVGLSTSGQLQAFRNQDAQADKSFRPCHTWWMSATLQPDWLKKSPDTEELSIALESSTFRIEREYRTGHLWDDVSRPIKTVLCEDTKAFATQIVKAHSRRRSEYDNKGPTLVVVNTVKRAVEIWEALKKDKTLKEHGTDLRLVHSRFRPIDRARWTNEFLNRESCTETVDRIIVCTQVIEAGVDISTSLLFTELAPWPSLVQRFGRCARWGGTGKVFVVDFGHDSDKKALPYSLDDLNASLAALGKFKDVGPSQLECFEEAHAELLKSLYPYDPRHLLLRHELDELFDTSPDLSGADIDISRFIRSGEERDVQVFWESVAQESHPSPSRKPHREELCGIPFSEARQWLSGAGKSENLAEGKRAWVWNWLGREWQRANRRDLYPGQTVLVEASIGGYSSEKGWSKSLREQVEPVAVSERKQSVSQPCWKWNQKEGGWEPSERLTRQDCPEYDCDDAEDDESLSITGEWQTIATHGREAGVEADQIAALLCSGLRPLLNLAGRWHDLGKAHPAFQGCIQADDRPLRDDLAKAPDKAWPCSPRNMYRIDELEQRRGFRHELASTLGLFAVLQRHKPEHEALLGPWAGWLDILGKESAIKQNDSEPNAIEQEILELSADDFDLLAYLVCAHHGKVRTVWHSSPSDQKADDSETRIRGVRNGDVLPPVQLASENGQICELPAASLDLSPSEIGLSHRTGRSWIERTLNLLGRYGPFSLAWLETLLRVADQRASRKQVSDTLLLKHQSIKRGTDNVGTRMDAGDSPMAESAAGRASEATSRSHPGSRRQLYGHGRRAGRGGMDSSTTRAPYGATRYVETRVGILSYQELAPLLAESVALTEFDIFERKFAELSIEDLLLELHRRMCGELLPDMAGRWRTREIRVGSHNPPPRWRVPVLMREFSADLKARLSNAGTDLSDQVAGDLAFAEGRLLHIHPFQDFNGRITRLFLIELLLRMDMPIMNTATQSVEERDKYFEALRAYDRNDPRPLIAIWQQRISKAA